MRYLLFLPGIILALIPVITAHRQYVQAEREAREVMERKEATEAQRRAAFIAKQAEKAEREAERQRKQAERLEIAKQRAEYAERERDAMRELRAMKRGESIPAAEPEPAADPVPAAEPAVLPFAITGNNAFSGEVVAFTGTLPNMSRREAIEAVKRNGGRAFEGMNASTTLLVVGNNPGTRKLDKADAWIGQVRKITAEQFDGMLKQPLTMTPDQFVGLLLKGGLANA